jgi:glycosyltransferase involved in cell wall biosynthesis
VIKILIIPDIFYSNHSGAIAARAAAKIFKELGSEVRIFTSEPKINEIESNYFTYPRKNYTWKANYLESDYKIEFKKVLDDFSPDLVFIFGGIVNKPKCYTEISKRKGIKVAIFLLVQDFYCANLHAALNDRPCFKCLKSSFPNSFLNNCAVKSSSFKPAYLINYTIIRQFIITSLKTADYVFSSTDEQLKILNSLGIESQKLIKCPLFFDESRINNFTSLKGNYFVVSGQLRREKGLQLLPKIVDNINVPVKIKIPFSNKIEADNAIAIYQLQKYVSDNIIEILPYVTWENGGEKLLAESLGVINPTIWPTTTEFVLLETLGYGKPIFTFAVGVHKEKIKNYENGFVAEITDYKTMGQQIESLMSDPKLYNKISEGAIKLYYELLNKEKFNRVLSKIIS